MLSFLMNTWLSFSCSLSTVFRGACSPHRQCSSLAAHAAPGCNSLAGNWRTVSWDRSTTSLLFFSCTARHLGFFALCEQALEGAEPLGHIFLIWRAEAVVTFFGDDLHTKALCLGHGIDLHGIEDVCEGDDEVCGIFLAGVKTIDGLEQSVGRRTYVFVLVEAQGPGAQNYPELLPLSYAPF